MSNWGIYARQSLDVTEGVARQIVRCRALVESRGAEVGEVYEDNDTSASKARGRTSAWGRMLADIRAGKIDTVVAVDMDRLLRSMRDLVTLTDLGARVLTVSGEIDLTTADGAFRAQMLAAIAEFEVRRKSERSRRANQDRVERLGLPVPGKRRYGFEPGNIEERPAEAERVRWAFEALLDGASVFSIAKELGRPPVRLRELLTNPSYAGWVVRGAEKFDAHPDVARIIERDTWEAVQAILSAPGRKTSPGNQIKFLASGIARCGAEGCGARLVKQGPNYLCKGNLSHPTIKTTILDRKLAMHALMALWQDNPSAEPLELREAVRQVAEAQTRRARLQDMATWDGADVSELKRQIAAVGRDIAKLEEHVSTLRAAAATDDALSEFLDLMAETGVIGEDGLPTFTLDPELWLDIWEDVPLGLRRDVLSRFDIRVHNGRGPDRVSIVKR